MAAREHKFPPPQKKKKHYMLPILVNFTIHIVAGNIKKKNKFNCDLRAQNFL